MCFAAGTPLRTPEGWKWIEAFREGDLVLSRDENNPYGLVVAKVVEEVFVREGLIWNLHIGGQVIRTTAEHPFYAEGHGWVACHELRVGERLLTESGAWAVVEDLLDTGEWETVYNLRIADFHTYFVGCDEWGFSVWAHNADCGVRTLKSGEVELFELSNPSKVLFTGTQEQAAIFAARGSHTINGLAPELPQILTGHPNLVDGLPFGYKEKPFSRFVRNVDEEMARAGFDDVQAFMQGSTASGVKHSTKQALDARAGIMPKDYDVAIVSPKLAARAAELGLTDIFHGPMTSKHIAALGLSEGQAYLTTASKGGLPVNFKLYRSVLDVYDAQPTIPFAKFKG